MAEPAPTPTGSTITRVFDAPRERVWQEWTEPERFADWFGGAEAEIPIATVSMDVRRAALEGDDVLRPRPRESQWDGEYREVLAPERLVFTISDRPDGDSYELIVVVLTDLGDGRTEMLHPAARRHAPGAVRARRAGLGRVLRPDGRAAGRRLDRPGGDAGTGRCRVRRGRSNAGEAPPSRHRRRSVRRGLRVSSVAGPPAAAAAPPTACGSTS